jgi:hypothetical protein
VPRRLCLCITVFVLCLSLVPKGQSRPIKALVGGTLIDGNASRPIQNSVILVEGKVDVIKLIDQDEMTMEEVRAVVAEAHRLRKPVVAHAHRPEEIRRALAAGVDCLEHTGLATAPEYPPDIIAMLRERTAKMSLGPLWWTPTVEGLLNYEYFRDNPEALDDPAWQEGLPKDIVDDVKKSIEHPDRLPY